MSNKFKAAAVLLSVGFLTVLGFQNCSNSFSPATSGAAAIASCKSQSILRNAYPRGTTFSIPMGSTFTPLVCQNQSAFDTMEFNASTQSLTLTGSGASKVFSLDTGGDGCSAGMLVGGDRWKSATGEFLETNLGPDELQITQGQDITCHVQR